MKNVLQQILLLVGGSVPVVGQILAIAVPAILDEVQRRHAQTGQLPTNEQMQAILTAHLDQIAAEGAAWTAAHPRPVN